MADVHVQSYGTFASNVFSGTPSPLPRPYLPSLPPAKTIKPSYSRFLIEAPYSALAGVVADARDPPKPPLLPRSRNRIQVGCTNRWRLPSVLGSDLLGSSQALKSVNSSYNDTIRAVMTEEKKKNALNVDVNRLKLKHAAYVIKGGLGEIKPSRMKPPLLPRSRNRIQVGCTNRWRLPSVLGSDLLGSSQALKSVNSSYNDTIRAVMTADCPRVACNHLDEGREKSSQTPVHTVVSPRFLKSQPAPGLTTSTRDLDQRLVQSQPVAFSVLPRREPGSSELSPFHLKQIDYQRNVISPAMRCPTPMELFLLRSQVVGAHTIPAVGLFTWSEYSLYKLLAYWIFLQQHPNLQMMPSWGTVVTWFMSLPKGTSFLEREEGHGYVSLFRTVRLSGITDSSQLDELQKMNLIPQSWLLRVYTQHYHAVGDNRSLVRYCIRVQWFDCGLNKMFTSGILCHSFGLSGKNRQSEVVSVEDVCMPLYVSVSLMFPPS
ncbi:PREDICTED: BTB/POZ domain-containing protein 16-like [Acropora digitifera]|uniref:BTB/POZ domain-containing protein 16-like n=1 Tax=Acropora digitifera TaxID=70779 RepID=UPI00077B0406|nr:PREDICTED: BTB/POZ domain-containing protein 16-like [Acropora digitifera]